MSTYGLQTMTMLASASKSPSQILGLPAKRHLESKPQLPTKRKRESICGLGSFDKPFVIRPCPESPYDKHAPFKPIRVIGRSQLPLSFLDTSPDENFAPNRLFSASIEVLEKQYESQDKGNTAPKVLIARCETNKALYAIERVQQHVFSLCRLAAWLKEKDVAELWDPANLEMYPPVPRSEETTVDKAGWWQQAVLATSLEERPVKRARLSMLRPTMAPVSLPTEADERQQAAVIEKEVPLATQKPDVQQIAMEAPPPQQILDNFVQQYLDAVYLSKTSLAYFAKGPITRARTAFVSSEEGAPPTYDLVVFLRSMLLSHKASEKKYQDKLPEIIKSMPPGMFSDEEYVASASKPKRSRKKIKLGKEGIYPQEEEVVRKWWVSEISSPEKHGEESIEQRVKRRIGDLRVRETLAQMILMLEIIALEALSTYKEPVAEAATGAAGSENQEESQVRPKKRKKKLDDVKLLLDLLLDKLCIWQSVDQDGLVDFDAKISKSAEITEGSGRAGSSDRLQSFCIEVIIPFYVSRLPEQALMINKKLGGPTHTSPPKRKAAKPPITSRKSGEPKEPDTKKSRRSLGRVATDTGTQNAQRRPTPALHRSTTDSALIDGIKREASEVPLAAIPFQRSPSQAARQSLSHLKLLKGRQIDLSAPSATAAAKLKQKKRVEEDLKEAISALKKPNRNLAAGGYVDDIERRGLGPPSKSRKPAVTVRKILKDVQVSATPRAIRRTKDVVEQTPNHHRNPFFREQRTDSPPTSTPCIPSSGIVPGTVQRSVTARHLAAPGIAETPSKAPNGKGFDDSGACRRTIFATPAKVRAVSPASPTAVFATPLKASVTIPPTTTSTTSAVFATPKRNAPATTAAESTPLPLLKPAQNHEEPSIYDALGWNDDDDFL